MLKKTSSFIVNRRIAILVCVLVLALAGAVGSLFVTVNTDMTKYLPEDSRMKAGLDIMNEAFPAMEMPSTIRVMFDDLSDAEQAQVLETLQAIEHVDSVEYEPTGNAFHRDDHTLFVLHMSCDYGSAEEKAIEAALAQQFSGKKIVWHDDATTLPEIPVSVYAVVGIILLVILLTMCGSWLEPLLFLATIGCAILINLGTNLLLGSVSSVTKSIAAILQLALSMDYSIILMNRYRQERIQEPDPLQAMKHAWANAFSSVASSALTTVAGLLMLLFMSFKIGTDIGIVLAKGVLISMLCVLTILPALILLFDPLLRKTAKKELHIPMHWAARLSRKLRFGIVGLFLALFVGFYFLQTQTGIAYILVRNDPVAAVFPKRSTIVLVYENRDEPHLKKLLDKLEQDEQVSSVTAYCTSLGKACTVQELASMLGAFGGGLPVKPALIQLLYYQYYSDGLIEPMTVGDFLSFLSEHVLQDETFSAWIDDETREQAKLLVRALSDPTMQGFQDSSAPEQAQRMSAAKAIVDAASGNRAYSPEEMQALLSGWIEQLDQASVELLYLYKQSMEASDPSWTMTPEGLFNYLTEHVVNDPRYSAWIDASLSRKLQMGQAALQAGKAQLVSDRYSRLVFTTTYPDESEATTAFLQELHASLDRDLDGDSYLIGNAVMAYEMKQSFGKELLSITLLTALAIFLIVALTFRSVFVPIILVLLVQTGVFITVTVTGIMSGSMYYLALLMVECILMGATIDYGILFTNYYRENRKVASILGALERAYAGSVHTILTSGLILVMITAAVGRLFEDETVTEIVRTISIGSLSVILLILFVLPGVLAACDKLVTRKKDRLED